MQAVIRNTELVVGDVLHVDTGDKLAADGLVIDSQVRCLVWGALCKVLAAPWSEPSHESDRGQGMLNRK